MMWLWRRRGDAGIDRTGLDDCRSGSTGGGGGSWYGGLVRGMRFMRDVL